MDEIIKITKKDVMNKLPEKLPPQTQEDRGLLNAPLDKPVLSPRVQKIRDQERKIGADIKSPQGGIPRLGGDEPRTF